MTDRTVEEVKQRIDIVDVVKEYLPLTKAGGNHKGLCPFHHEKSPSFMVSQEKQIWHCFGCGEGGDVFSFLQKIDGLDFPETLRLLAERAGVPITRYDPKVANAKTRLLDCVKAAMDFYVAARQKSQEGVIARNYLQQRKIESITQDQFQLGYAPDQWDALLNFLRKRKFTDREIADAGLSANAKGRTFDRFRKRLMFPLWDYRGTVVGFTGRILDNQQPGGKYVNSPQSTIYDKSRLVYALDKAKNTIRQKGVVVLVEGQMDVITAHQAGFTNVVATSGTALTDAQVQLLSRYATTFLFCFDADTAGVTAARRAIDLATRSEITVKVVTLPYGKDPDECIQKDPSAFGEALEHAKPAMDYLFDLLLTPADLTQADVKKKIAIELLTEVGKLDNPVERTHYIEQLADRLGARRSDLHELFVRLRVQKKSPAHPSRPTSVSSPAPLKPISVIQTAGEQTLAMAIAKPDLLRRVVQSVLPEDFIDSSHQALYKEIVLFYTANDLSMTPFTVERLNPQFFDLANTLSLLGSDLVSDKDTIEVEHELHLRMQLLARARIQRQLRVIETRIRQIEGDSSAISHEEVQRLLQESARLSQELRRSM